MKPAGSENTHEKDIVTLLPIDAIDRIIKNPTIGEMKKNQGWKMKIMQVHFGLIIYWLEPLG